MLPAKFAPILFALFLSAIMSLVVSGFSTYRAIGLSFDFVSIWLSTWVMAWALAFPTALIIAPFVRRIVKFLTVTPPSDSLKRPINAE